jgi:hypothetical protein
MKSGAVELVCMETFGRSTEASPKAASVDLSWDYPFRVRHQL